MNERYAEYLNSDAWKAKRNQRLALSKYKCAACGSSNGLEVHHLTYARIFHEDMADLLPLCWLHHLAAEEMVAKGLITRTDDVLFLATETIRLIAPGVKFHADFDNRTNRERNAGNRNECQEQLMSEQWFLDALALKRNAFKGVVRQRFKDHKRKATIMANAFGLYHRKSYLYKKKKPKKNKLQKPEGGWTRVNLAALGVPWPPPRGWKKRLERGQNPIPESVPEPIQHQHLVDVILNHGLPVSSFPLAPDGV